LDQAIAQSDNMENGKFVVHDALNDRNVALTPRQLELIRRVQAGAFAHPEFDGNPDYIDYYSSIPEISGLNSNRTEPKARFQPSQWEKVQLDRLLKKLERGDINMDYLTGKVRDMNDVRKKKDGQADDKPYLMWKGDEEDLLNMRKGPQHIAPPKVPPPGHAESYRPPDEYLPTEEDLKKWEEMEVKDRPHGRLIPKQFPNLRSLGAYEHAVTETFERCLDLYLCPRIMKRRLNIDPESLVPKLPKASDLRPFPTAKCIEYTTKYEGDEAPLIRCLSPSPDGQYIASGSSDGVVRIWEVQTGRMLRSWNINELVKEIGFGTEGDNENASPKAIVAMQWNPNRNHHCLAAAVGNCVVIIATGTAGDEDAELTEALLMAARKGGKVTNEKAAKAVQWRALDDVRKAEQPISAYDGVSGPIAALKTNREVSYIRWHSKGDYFVSVSPKAASASVLIHQLSKGNSQQPFSKAKGETQLACFHPNKPFLFVASQNHIRIYHLVKQAMVKRKFIVSLPPFDFYWLPLTFISWL
jgi:ribosome biogenesis protein ERB1